MANDDMRVLKFLEFIPKKYKEGPWSPFAHLVIFGFVGFLLLTLPMAIESASVGKEILYVTPTSYYLQAYRISISLYTMLIGLAVLVTAGPWLFASYTLTSWNLLTLRMVFAALAGMGYKDFDWIAHAVRFPALVGCTVTVTVWWSVLVPLISHHLKKLPEDLAFFKRFNFSFVLVNVHLLNLPFALIEFILCQQKLVFFDLWMGILIGIAYMFFYLNVLDPRGLHFYIVFTPRTPLCVFSYALIFAFYYGIYSCWNAVLAWIYTTPVAAALL